MPSSKNYKRNYKQEYNTDSPARRKARAERNAARRELVKEGLVKKGDNKEVNHVKPLSKGGDNARKNLSVVAAAKNHSYPRTKSGAMKAKLSNPPRRGRR